MHNTSLQYFYHPDHLGSASWITDADGNGYQHLQYLPFGESWVEQRLGTYNTPYQFSGKEKDEETGYNYFGARYYDSGLSVWLSVDPKAGKYLSYTPYCFALNRPIVFSDPNGQGAIIRIFGWTISINGTAYLYPGNNVDEQEIHSALNGLSQASQHIKSGTSTYTLNHKNNIQNVYVRKRLNDRQLLDKGTMTIDINFRVRVISKAEAEQRINTAGPADNFFEVSKDLPSGTQGYGKPGYNIGYLALDALKDNTLLADGTPYGVAVMLEEFAHTYIGMNYENGSSSHAQDDAKTGLCKGRTGGGSTMTNSDAHAILDAIYNTSGVEKDRWRTDDRYWIPVGNASDRLVIPSDLPKD
jgi:RHS repeat-associated protein